MRRARRQPWRFKARFRRHAFGWRSQPAIQRVKEAVAEIKSVSRTDAVGAAEGAVLFLERLSPALENIDSSSGAIGAAVNNAIATLVPEDLPVDTVGAHQLDELLGTREHQGIALQVDDYPYADAERLLQADVLVVLDEVTDPHNLGAVARSALAAGAGGLVVPRHRSARVTPAAVKASAGTLEYLPVGRVTNVVAFLRRARDAGFWVYGAAGEAAASYLETDLTGRIVIVAGAEGRGLRPLVARTCDALVSIPMDPTVESLNVSVAAALLLYEARRQREAAAR